MNDRFAHVARVDVRADQLVIELDAIASDRRDDSKLRKMGADRIDHRRLLADEEMARAMEHQAALLLGP